MQRSRILRADEPTVMKTAFVTGAGRGLGLSLCRALLRRGYRVAMFSRDGESLRAEALKLGPPSSVMAIEGDVTQAASLRRALADVEAEWGAVDLAIANAGMRGATRVADFPLETAIRIMETNYFGMLHLFAAAMPGMLARKNGCFVGIASIAGTRCLAGGSAYGASKAAMQSFLDTTRLDVRPYGVQVVTVNPWFVRTRPEDDHVPRPMQVDVEWAAERIVRGIEQGRTQIEFPWLPSLAWKLLRLVPNSAFVWLLGPRQAR
jgi:NAD(P)-dependent dehydrogenase (short-subunit alcohol dehydrogenase family)